jgi:hypothetical protein
MSSFYFGLWEQGAGAEFISTSPDPQVFHDFQQNQFTNGFRITSLQISALDGVVNYTAVAHPGSGAQAVIGACDWDAFSKWYGPNAKNGLHLSSLSTCVIGGQVLYAGVMRPAGGAMFVQQAADWQTFSAWVTNMLKEGLYVTSLSVCVLNGAVLYAGVAQPGSGAEWMTPAVDGKDFSAWYNGQAKKGFQLKSVSTCTVNGQIMYSGVVYQASVGQWMSGPLPWTDFLTQETKALKGGSRLAAFLTTEVLPQSHTWQLSASSAGQVDFNGGSVFFSADGTWSFTGSVHDNSFWYGDTWAYAFAILGRGQTASGTLGAELSGPAVDAVFKLGGKDPWFSQNWAAVVQAGIHFSLRVTGDPSGLVGLIETVAKDVGTIVSIVEAVAA